MSRVARTGLVALSLAAIGSITGVAAQPLEAPSVTFLSFLEGDPELPGDGQVVRATAGRFRLAPLFPLRGVADGLTLTVFLPRATPSFSHVGITTENVNDPRPRCRKESVSGERSPLRPATFKGVVGVSQYLSPAFLRSIVNFHNQIRVSQIGLSGCPPVALDDLFITELELFVRPVGTAEVVDAVAIGNGPQAIPR